MAKLVFIHGVQFSLFFPFSVPFLLFDELTLSCSSIYLCRLFDNSAFKKGDKKKACTKQKALRRMWKTTMQ